MKRESLNRCAFGSLAMAVLAALLSFTVGAGQIVHAATSPTAAIVTITPPFLPRSALNRPIPPNPPIHPDSTSMIQYNPNWVIPSGDPAYLEREWLGPRQRTFYTHTDARTPSVTMHVNAGFGGYGCDKRILTVPLPKSVQQVLLGQAGTYDHDTSTWLVDANGNAWEGYAITAPGTPSRDIVCNIHQWNALRMDYWGPGSVGNERTGNGYGAGYGASASHIQSGAGLIRPEETQLPTGSNLGHALLIDGYLGANGTFAGHPRFVSPAASGDGHISGASGIPYGARVQLDPSINVGSWASVNVKAEPWREGLKKILRTLQVYGAIIVDTTRARGAGGIAASHRYPALPYLFPWEAAGYGWSYGNGIPYDLMSHFRVIDWRLWTGASPETLSAPSNTGVPVIKGTPRVGSRPLKASKGTWANSPTRYAYRWFRCKHFRAKCAPISGATGARYSVASADVRLRLRVAVIASNSGGSTSAMSARSAIVTAGKPK